MTDTRALVEPGNSPTSTRKDFKLDTRARLSRLRNSGSFIASQTFDQQMDTPRHSYPIAYTILGSRAAEVDRALNSWSLSPVGARIVRNVKMLEHFLAPRSMASLLGPLAAGSLEAIPLIYEHRCRDFKMCGGRVQDPPPLIGRAVDEETFATRLWERRVFFSVPQAKEALQRLGNGFGLPDRLRGQLMSPHISWVTFDTANGHPWAFADGASADELRASLGLSIITLGAPLLLLTYKRSRQLDLFRPTVADAELCEHFEPAGAKSPRHGLTVPWGQEMIELARRDIRHQRATDPLFTGAGTIRNNRVVSRPEAVHASVTFDQVDFIRAERRN